MMLQDKADKAWCDCLCVIVRSMYTYNALEVPVIATYMRCNNAIPLQEGLSCMYVRIVDASVVMAMCVPV